MSDTISEIEIIDQFRRAAAKRDVILPDRVIADGEIHRCNTDKKNGRGDASYLLHLDEFPAGGFQNWQDGQGWEKWCAREINEMSSTERDQYRRKCQVAVAKREAEIVERQTKCAAFASSIWDTATPVPGTPAEIYLKYRGVPIDQLPTGALDNLRYHANCPTGDPQKPHCPALIARLRDVLTSEPTGAIHRTFIREDGTGKADLETQKKALGKYGDNGVVILGKIEPGAVVAETEGIEDGLSIVAATGGVAIATLGDTRLGKICLPADIERIVCGDAKTAKDKSTARQGAQTAADRELRDVRLCFPSDGTGDFNKLLKTRGVEAITSAIREAEIIRPDTSGLIFLTDILNRKEPSSEYVVKGVFDRGQVGQTFGISQAAKTFLDLDMAVHIVLGRLWFNRRVRAGPVLYVQLESKAQFDDRILAVAADMTENEKVILDRNFARLDIDPFLGQGPEGDKGERTIIEFAKKLERRAGQPVALIIIDTASKAYAGNDNNAAPDISRFIRRKIAIASATGAAVMDLHQPNKSDATAPGGAGQHVNDNDFLIRVDVPDQTGGIAIPASTIREIVIEKNKSAPSGVVIGSFKLAVVTLRMDSDGDPVTSCVIDVIEECATRQRQPKRRRPSTQAAKALEEFNQLIIAGKGRPAPPNDRIPPGATVVNLGDWQAACARKGLSNSAQANAKERNKVERKAFMRATEDLEKKGWIAVFDGLVWRPDHVGRGQTNNWSDDPGITYQGQTGSDQKNEEYQSGAKRGHAGSSHKMDPAGSRGQRVPTPIGVGPLDPASDPSGTQPKSEAFPGEHEADFDDAAEEFELEL